MGYAIDSYGVHFDAEGKPHIFFEEPRITLPNKLNNDTSRKITDGELDELNILLSGEFERIKNKYGFKVGPLSHRGYIL